MTFEIMEFWKNDDFVIELLSFPEFLPVALQSCFLLKIRLFYRLYVCVHVWLGIVIFFPNTQKSNYFRLESNKSRFNNKIALLQVHEYPLLTLSIFLFAIYYVMKKLGLWMTGRKDVFLIKQKRFFGIYCLWRIEAANCC